MALALVLEFFLFCYTTSILDHKSFVIILVLHSSAKFPKLPSISNMLANQHDLAFFNLDLASKF